MKSQRYHHNKVFISLNQCLGVDARYHTPTMIKYSDLQSFLFRCGIRAVWMGYPIRLELIRVGLLVLLANHYTTGSAHDDNIWSKLGHPEDFSLCQWSFIFAWSGKRKSKRDGFNTKVKSIWEFSLLQMLQRCIYYLSHMSRRRVYYLLQMSMRYI